MGAPKSVSAAIFSLLWTRLQRFIPHDAFAVYCPTQEETLVAQFAAGLNSHLLSSLRIPLGEGLSGWVAENHKPILNGNPSVEPGYLNDPEKHSTLRAALAVPVEAEGKIVAVLALYRAAQDSFTRDDLLVLQEMASHLAGTMARFRQVQATAAGAGK